MKIRWTARSVRVQVPPPAPPSRCPSFEAERLRATMIPLRRKPKAGWSRLACWSSFVPSYRWPWVFFRSRLGLAFIGSSSDSDSFKIGSSRETKLPGELSRIEQIRRIALIQHLVRLADQGIEPPSHPEHWPTENPIFWRQSEFLRGHCDELFAGWRIGGGWKMPYLVPCRHSVCQQG